MVRVPAETCSLSSRSLLNSSIVNLLNASLEVEKQLQIFFLPRFFPSRRIIAPERFVPEDSDGAEAAAADRGAAANFDSRLKYDRLLL